MTDCELCNEAKTKGPFVRIIDALLTSGVAVGLCIACCALGFWVHSAYRGSWLGIVLVLAIPFLSLGMAYFFTNILSRQLSQLAVKHTRYYSFDGENGREHVHTASTMQGYVLVVRWRFGNIEDWKLMYCGQPHHFQPSQVLVSMRYNARVKFTFREGSFRFNSFSAFFGFLQDPQRWRPHI